MKGAMELELLLLYTLAICKGSTLVTEEPPVTLPPSGVLPPANLVDAVIINHHVCLLPGEESTPFTFGCGIDTGVQALTILNAGVGGWSSAFDNDTYCPVTNPECTASQLERVLASEFVTFSSGGSFPHIDIDVPGCTEPTNFVDIDMECMREAPKSVCNWEGFSSAENLHVMVRDYQIMCRCVITTPPGTGLSAYVNLTLVTTKFKNGDPEGSIFVQYDGDVQYETPLREGLRRISMVENLLLESDKQLVLAIDHENTATDVDMMFTFRASSETHLTCYDKTTDFRSP